MLRKDKIMKVQNIKNQQTFSAHAVHIPAPAAKNLRRLITGEDYRFTTKFLADEGQARDPLSNLEIREHLDADTVLTNLERMLTAGEIQPGEAVSITEEHLQRFPNVDFFDWKADKGDKGDKVILFSGIEFQPAEVGSPEKIQIRHLSEGDKGDTIISREYAGIYDPLFDKVVALFRALKAKS